MWRRPGRAAARSHHPLTAPRPSRMVAGDPARPAGRLASRPRRTLLRPLSRRAGHRPRGPTLRPSIGARPGACDRRMTRRDSATGHRAAGRKRPPPGTPPPGDGAAPPPTAAGRRAGGDHAGRRRQTQCHPRPVPVRQIAPLLPPLLRRIPRRAGSGPQRELPDPRTSGNARSQRQPTTSRASLRDRRPASPRNGGDNVSRGVLRLPTTRRRQMAPCTSPGPDIPGHRVAHRKRPCAPPCRYGADATPRRTAAARNCPTRFRSPPSDRVEPSRPAERTHRESRRERPAPGPPRLHSDRPRPVPRARPVQPRSPPFVARPRRSCTARQRQPGPSARPSPPHRKRPCALQPGVPAECTRPVRRECADRFGRAAALASTRSARTGLPFQAHAAPPGGLSPARAGGT